MTCEIALMNQSAVVLAADSAMTVRRWVNGERQTRYFKGSNKIFQLSNVHPVGLMVFGSASVQGVPWELVVKEFRKHLGATSFPKVEGYAEALRDFVKQHPSLFPADKRIEDFIDATGNTMFALLSNLTRVHQLDNPAGTPQEGATKVVAILEAEIQRTSQQALPQEFPQNAPGSALDLHREALVREAVGAIEYYLRIKKLDPGWMVPAERLAVLAVETLFREYNKILEESGVVIAGYGEQDIYPNLIEFSCYGFVLDSFLLTHKAKDEISLKRYSSIRPFATTAMVETFMMGFSEDVFTTVTQEYRACSLELARRIEEVHGTGETPNLDQIVEDSTSIYQERWTSRVAEDHLRPLRDVISSLPIEEMASLAETLVLLQSLKEKVTSPTESVGGPIDVAVISKHEGLIWIKRKHYFDPSKNSRFFKRQS